MFVLYQVVYATALALRFPLEYAKRSRALRARWRAERFGVCPQRAGSAPLLWIHAVSVGEVIAASSFIRAFQARHPGYEVALSTVTDTGQTVARERLGESVLVFYMPFDLGFALRRAIGRLRPSLVVIMETELWPAAIGVFNASHIPVALLNGRISEKSYEGYRRIRAFLRPVLRGIGLFCMQDETYARRIIDLGADNKNVIVTGSFKFDIKVKAEEVSWAGQMEGQVLVAGSTHPGEDELFLDVYQRLRTARAGLVMVLAPRHPERAGNVEALVRSRGLPCQRRTRLAPGEKIRDGVFLLDTVGELSSVYQVSHVAMMGGSFVPRGGQNFLEPAFWGKPVVCGPYMGNFPFVSEFYRAGAALEADAGSLYNVLEELLASPERRRTVGERAKALLDKNRGAVESALEALDALMKRVQEPVSHGSF